MESIPIPINTGSGNGNVGGNSTNSIFQQQQQQQQQSNSSLLDSNLNRHRSVFTLPLTPGNPHHLHHLNDDNQTSTSTAEDYQYHPNGGTFKNNRQSQSSHHSHSYSDSLSSSKDKETHLSTFLSNLFLSAKSTIKRSNSLTSLSLSNVPLLSTSTSSPSTSSSTFFQSLSLPSKSTLSFISLCTLWYLSSALSSNTGKVILTQFRYPVTLTLVQFLFVALYSIIFLGFKEFFSKGFRGDGGNAVWSNGGRSSLSNSRSRSKSTSFSTSNSNSNSFSGSLPGGPWQLASKLGIKKPSKIMFEGTLIMSLFQIAGHIFSSMAIQRVPVSTVHTIKALSPLFTVLAYTLLFKIRYTPSTYLALTPLTLGVMLACSFDLKANALGLICALGSTIIFVSQNIFLKRLLPRDNEGSPSGGGGTSTGPKLDKLNLLFYSSFTAFILTTPIWFYSDFPSLISTKLPPIPLSTLHSSSLPSPPSLLLYFTLNGTTNFSQNLIAFAILSRTSPVTYSIASLVKRIAVIVMAIIWSGQHVTLLQGIGMGLAFVGLGMYNNAKKDVEKGERKRVVVERRMSMSGGIGGLGLGGGGGGGGLLPSTLDDLREMEGSGGSTPVERERERVSVGGLGGGGGLREGDYKNGSVSGGAGGGSSISGPGGVGGPGVAGSYIIPFPTPPASPFR